MRLVGRVRAGAGLGAPRMSDPHVMELISGSVGFRPVPGTLNVVLEQPFDRALATGYVSAKDLSPTWQDDVGQAGYWLTPIVVAGQFQAVAVQANEPGYPPEQIELLCAVRLRDALGLDDGDSVSISVADG
jgi:riboflavin kinase